MTRGEYARAAGVHPETVRFYERSGLLPPPRRGRKGERLYGEEEVRDLRVITRLRSLGFSIDEILKLRAMTAEQPDGELERRVRAMEQQQQELRALLGRE